MGQTETRGELFSAVLRCLVAAVGLSAGCGYPPTPPLKPVADGLLFHERELDPGHGKIAIADLNNDGRNDLVMLSEDELIWFETPTGSDIVKHTVLRNIRFRGDRIDTADIDKDGDVDIVTTRSKSLTGDDQGFEVIWLRNPQPERLPSLPEAWQVLIIGNQEGYMKDTALADFNLDGRIDVVTRANKQTAIYFQESPERWSRGIVLFHESHEGMDLGDLDRDGDPDIVLNGFWFETPSDAVRGKYVRHEFDKKWFTPVDGSWRDNSAAIKVADFNDDQILDILISHSELPGYPISLYMAASLKEVKADRWQEVQVAQQFDFCQTLDAADVDNDGDLDILAAKFERDRQSEKWRNQPPYPVVVFHNIDGRATEWWARRLSDGGMYAGVLGDVDSDGDWDVVGSRSYWTGPVKIWENTVSDEKLSLDRWHYIEIDDSRERRTFGLALGDVNGDGYPDIAAGNHIYRNPGVDMIGHWQKIMIQPGLESLFVLDVDRDQYADIFGGSCNQQFWAEATDERGEGWKVTNVAALPVCDHKLSTQSYKRAQLIPGGAPEILIAGGGIYYIEIPNDPRERPWPSQRIATDGTGYGAGDIDGDGYIDVAGSVESRNAGDPVPGTSNSHWWNSQIVWYKNPTDGSADWQHFVVGQATQADRFEVADLNGDSRPDIVVSEERYWGLDPNANLYWFEQPESAAGEWKRHTVVTQYSMNNLDLADMDRDGDIDIVTNEHRMPKGKMEMKEIERTQIWENNGIGHFTVRDVKPGKESHLGARVYDMDGDGDLDIVSLAWRNFEKLRLWRNDAVKK